MECIPAGPLTSFRLLTPSIVVSFWDGWLRWGWGHHSVVVLLLLGWSVLNGHLFGTLALGCWLPPNSIWSPKLFNTDMKSQEEFIQWFVAECHRYVAITQFSSSSPPDLREAVMRLGAAGIWMRINKLKLNSDKNYSQTCPYPVLAGTNSWIGSWWSMPSRLDYYNALYTGLPLKTVHKLQLVQKAVAHVAASSLTLLAHCFGSCTHWFDPRPNSRDWFSP